MQTGRCQCGSVRFTIDAEPVGLYACHCIECRKQSASAFGISVIMPRTSFRIAQGEPKSWTRPADSGNRVRCWFCPDCGSRLWHEADPPDSTISIKGGALDRDVDLSKAVHIWTARKLPGVVIPPDAEQYPAEPPED